jgi:hypothetical protein
MVELPTEYATELGRVVFHSSQADLLLERLHAAQEGRAEGRGLSGTRLLNALRPLAERILGLQEVIDGYEALYDWRNRLVHGSHSYSGETLWTWHVPTRGHGNSAQSYQLPLENLRQIADGWQALAGEAHALLHDNQGE